MDEKINILREKLKELQEKMIDPAVISDRETYAHLGREFSDINSVISDYDELEALEKQIEKNNLLIADIKEKELSELADEENKILETKKTKLLVSLKDYFSPQDPRDTKDIIMEIRQAAGGDEAGLFAAELFRMYTKFAESQGWKANLLEQSQTGIGGLKEAIFEIEGRGAWSSFKNEAGVHRVQRVPTTETVGRVHTSTVTVAVMPEAEEVDIKIRPEDLRIDVFRAGGHGGQSVNTTDSAVRITHVPSGTVVSMQDEKSQLKNKEKAMKILRSRILAQEAEKTHKELAESKKLQVGTGERSEKIRTYNYPQDRVTDHRTGKNYHNLPAIMDGKIDEIIEDLKKLG